MVDKALRPVVAQGDMYATVNATGCGFDSQSRKWNIYLNLYFHFYGLVSSRSAALSSAIQRAMPLSSDKCLNTRFPVPTLLCAGYSVKLIFFIFISLDKSKVNNKLWYSFFFISKLTQEHYIMKENKQNKILNRITTMHRSTG